MWEKREEERRRVTQTLRWWFRVDAFALTEPILEYLTAWGVGIEYKYNSVVTLSSNKGHAYNGFFVYRRWIAKPVVIHHHSPPLFAKDFWPELSSCHLNHSDVSITSYPFFFCVKQLIFKLCWYRKKTNVWFGDVKEETSIYFSQFDSNHIYFWCPLTKFCQWHVSAIGLLVMYNRCKTFLHKIILFYVSNNKHFISKKSDCAKYII